MGLPADASGAYRPNPQATTKLAPRPSSLKGYRLFFFPCEVSKLREPMNFLKEKGAGQAPFSFHSLLFSFYFITS
jgi:hypothetical protein